MYLSMIQERPPPKSIDNSDSDSGSLWSINEVLHEKVKSKVHNSLSA